MNDELNNVRKEFDKLGLAYNKSDKVTIEQEIIGNTTCYWFNPNGKINANRLIIYLHGGCFVLGSINSHTSLVSHLSEQLAMPLLFIEYSLAPENPFPAAVKEIEKVYGQILSRFPEKEIVLMGDSAGGGLAITIIADLNKWNSRLPVALVMLSPWVDLSCTNNSLLENKDSDPILTKKALQDYASMYVNGNKLQEASPIEKMDGKYPPTLVLVSSSEILLDDGKTIIMKIAGSQPKTRLSIHEKQNHVWLLADIHSSESKMAIQEIREFIS